MCRPNIGPTLFVNIVSTLIATLCQHWANVIVLVGREGRGEKERGGAGEGEEEGEREGEMKREREIERVVVRERVRDREIWREIERYRER